MSVPSKSIDKNKRYAGVKANDFVNKTRTNETSRATARTQGWANLGKISSRRVPPPANLPSLKSETGVIVPSFDPTISTGTTHGWTASGNQTPTTLVNNQTRPLTPSKQPTQQQLDSLPANASTPPPQSSSSLPSDLDKPRISTTWSSVTAGNTNDQPPNLLGLNDFPRLVTQENKSLKSPSDSIIGSISTTTTQGPSFRPANLASWKEGGGRAQPLSNDLTKDSNDNNNLSNLSMQSQMLSTNTNTNLLQSQMQNPNNSSYMRMYQQQQQHQQQSSPQMWAYNVGNSYGSYGSNQASSSMPMHQLHQQQRVSPFGNNHQPQQQQQRLNTSTDYKTPTILRNKDIDDLSKLTDNVTWANASEKVNYQEKIQFSDDENNDTVDNNNHNKPRRFNHSQSSSRQNYPQVLQNNSRTSNTNYSQQRSRLLQDDEHVKQMQDDKNSELISTLAVAKQRRDEQERSLRDTLPQRPTASTTVSKSFDDQKQIPGYQTRPLLTSLGQENLPTSQLDSTSLWGQTSNSGTSGATTTTTTTTSRTRHDTTDSQTFAMKSWSDQMDSFNYASLHEKSGGVDDDDRNDDTTIAATSGPSTSHKYSRSHSESSSQSQPDNGTTVSRSKHFPITNRKQPKSNIIQSKTSSNTSRMKSKTTDVTDYFDNNDQQMKSNDQWGDWEDTNFSTNNRYQQSYATDRRRHQHQQQQQQQSLDDPSQKPNRYNEQTNDYNRNKQSTKTRSNANRSSDMSSTSKAESKSTNAKSQPAWRALSPTRPIDVNDPTPQEAISYKSQTKTNDTNDRRQSAPTERKQRYTTSSTTINTSSIPPLMSVRSDVPPAPVSQSSLTTNSKHYKTSNQSQRQDYNSSSHYSQRNDFYNETNDSAWGNDDEYYDDETGYYDSNAQTHSRHHHSMGYPAHLHHRGYTTLGSYGRYRRGGTLRHQQQYATYNTNTTSGASSQLNTSTGSKTKKTSTTANNKKINESSEQIPSTFEPSNAVPDGSAKKASAWTAETKSSTIEEIPIIKSTETPSIPTSIIEKPVESISIPLDTKNENESNIITPSEVESTATNKKSTTTTTNTTQRKTTKDQQAYQHDQHYPNQQAPRHRNNYTHSMQDYDAMQMTSHNYYGTNRRTTTRGGRNARMHDISGGYYYEHPQQRYSNRYSYPNEHYSQHPTRSTNKTTKRGGSTSTTDRTQNKQKTTSGNNSTTTNLRQQSASDNDLKEGEEWETASESSTNMRNTHHDNNNNQQQTVKSTTNETKPTNRDRTPPKKSFSSQRPLGTRYNESGTHRRPYNLYDRGSKITRNSTQRTSRLSANSNQNDDAESSTAKSTAANRKDQHRHSLDGYDLNNVAGVVKIETLPAGALEEESTVFDDGGEEFCVVMSKRGRKEQKAAQLSKQNALESTTNTNIPNEQLTKTASLDNDEQQTNDNKSDENQASSTRSRTGKSLPPRFNSKSSSSTTRQYNTKADHQNASSYYYDQNYYYYDQNQYYDHDGSYYNYGNYNQSHRQSSTRRKQRNPPHQESTTIDDQLIEKKPEPNPSDKIPTTPSNVMSNIQMWVPHTDNTMSNSSKLIEKPTHDRKFGNEIVPPSSSNDASLPLHQRTATALTTHSPVSKTNETIARTIKPPGGNNKSDRDTKTKSANYEKNDTISSLGSNQLFEKSTFLDYDDKQYIGAVGDDYNQKISSLKPLWDTSDHPSGQLEQTINTMVAMKQQQEHGGQVNNSTKTSAYVSESNSASAANLPGANSNVSSAVNDDMNNKNAPPAGNLQSTGSSSTINQPPTYSTTTGSNKNEQKNICTVKPTQQVAPNIQDQVDVSGYSSFAPPPLQPAMSQASLQQHIPPQSQVNQLHQQPSYPFYENLLPPPPPPQQQAPQQQQQQQFNRYPPQNFPYRNTNVYMQQPPNVPNTNSMYHHTSQGSISAPQQNNAMPPPMPNYPSPFLVDHSGHMMSQAQPPPPPPPQAFMNNQMMSGRPQGGPYYRTPPPQQLQTPTGGPFGAQDQLAHGGYYPPFFQPPNSNAPPVGHPSAHNLYGQNEGFHPPHPPMFTRGGSIDRADHPLMSQPLSRPTNYPSTSSNQQQQGPPPSLLSQNLRSFHTNQQQSSSNQAPFYPPPPPPPNQYGRQPVPIGAMNSTTNRQQNPQVPSLMSGLSKNFSNNGNNLNNTQSLFQHRQPLLPPQSNNNRPLYQHHNQYSTYSKSTGPNDDNVKPKHI